MTPETMFPIASISKTVTATAIMRLVEQGKLELAAPVRRYLPEFAVADPAATRDVAIWHLLTHTPGWGRGSSTPEDYGVHSSTRFAESQQQLPQLAPPGEVFDDQRSDLLQIDSARLSMSIDSLQNLDEPARIQRTDGAPLKNVKAVHRRPIGSRCPAR